MLVLHPVQDAPLSPPTPMITVTVKKMNGETFDVVINEETTWREVNREVRYLMVPHESRVDLFKLQYRTNRLFFAGTTEEVDYDRPSHAQLTW